MQFLIGIVVNITLRLSSERKFKVPEHRIKATVSKLYLQELSQNGGLVCASWMIMILLLSLNYCNNCIQALNPGHIIPGMKYQVKRVR